jgi:hypothetical protein
MKRLILAFVLSCASVIGYSQTCPTPTGSQSTVSLKATYQVGAYSAGTTDVNICYKNNSTDLITGVQFRVWYDSAAFDGATPTVSSLNTSFTQSLDYKVDTANHNITITLVYTGSSATFSIPDGELFKLTFTHSSGFQNYATAISNMTFTGTQTFTAYSAKQNGMDTTLDLQNFGGVMVPQMLSYHGSFLNVTGSGAKNLVVGLEKKPKTGSTWTTQVTDTTDIAGNFSFNQAVDTTFYDVRLAVRGDTITVGNEVTSADAQKINRFVLGLDQPSGFDFYSADVNGSNNITVSDAWVVFGRLAGRFNAWVNNVPDIRFFTETEYNTITTNSSTNYTSTISGTTLLYFNILPGQPDSVTYYVLAPGDANGTGFNMARIVPIEIVVGSSNPANQQLHVIDATTEYDNASQLQTMEVNVPSLSVQAGNLVELPVKIKTPVPLGALQIAFKYDPDLLEYKSIQSAESVAEWMSFINPSANTVEWGGYDLNEDSKIGNEENAFTIQFIAKQPQDDWNKSPIYVTRKFAGDPQAKDMNITPTDGILQVYKMSVNPVDVAEISKMLAYPNPTSGQVNLIFEIKEEGPVFLGVYDNNGSKVIEVINRTMPTGKYQYVADLGKLSSGIYRAVLSEKAGRQSKGIIKIN